MAFPLVVRVPRTVNDGVLRAMDHVDRGAQLEPFSSDDQTDKVNYLFAQVAQRALNGRYAALDLGGGIIRVSDELLLDTLDGHRPVTIFGWGGAGAPDAPTVLKFTSDPGAGKLAIRKAGAARYTFKGFAVDGSGPSAPQKGHPMWACGGVDANGRGHIEDVFCGGGFRSTYYLRGDHIMIAHGGTYNDNRWGIEVAPDQASQGDIKVIDTPLNGVTQASIAVPSTVALAGFQMLHSPIGLCPFGIWRYDAGGTPITNEWLNALFRNTATEYIGNAVLRDDIQNGATVSVRWLEALTNWGLYSGDQDWSHNGETKPKEGAWVNGGPINFETDEGFPGMASGLPALRGTRVTVKAPNSGQFLLPKMIAGDRPIESTTSSPANVARSSLGSRVGNGEVLIQPVMLGTGTVARGECLTSYNELGVQKWSGALAADLRQRVSHVAAHDGDAASPTLRVVGGIKHGNHSDVQVKNTSGAPMNKTLFKPHPSGGVQPVTSEADKVNAIGRYLVDGVADGALGAAELWVP